MGVLRRVISTKSHPNNKGAIDWGWNGLLAYGVRSDIVVIDGETFKEIQTLSYIGKHRNDVKKILWCPDWWEKWDDKKCGMASADTGGFLTFWDVHTGKVTYHVHDNRSKQIACVRWLPQNNHNPRNLYLAALHSPNHFVIWNFADGCKFYTVNFPNCIFAFEFDPFDNAKMALLSENCVLYMEEFGDWKQMSGSCAKKIYISTPRFAEEHKARERYKKFVYEISVSTTEPRSDCANLKECVQMAFHRVLHNLLLLVFPRDVFIINLRFKAAVGVVSIDKSSSPFLQVISCSERDLWYCLHDTGNVSVRTRRRSNGPFAVPLETPTPSVVNKTWLDGLASEPIWDSDKCLKYDYHCQTEAVRKVKGSSVLGMSLCPISQSRVALLFSSGRIAFARLSCSNESRQQCLSSMIPPSTDDHFAKAVTLNMTTYGATNGYTQFVTVAKAFIKNNSEDFGNDYLALGMGDGHLLIYNVSRFEVEKEFAIHGSAVRGIEWADKFNLLSWSYSEELSPQSGCYKVKNELAITNVKSGRSRDLRHNYQSESPVKLVRVSPLKTYFIVVKSDGKMELWNYKSFSYLRSMSDKFPMIKGVEWMRIKLETKNGGEVDDEGRRKSLTAAVDSSYVPATREGITFTDADGALYYLSVRNNVLQNGVKFTPKRQNVYSVTCLASDGYRLLAQGDMDGFIGLYALTNGDKIFPGGPKIVYDTLKGCVVKICFRPRPSATWDCSSTNDGPTTTSLLALFADGTADVFDVKYDDVHSLEKISRCKFEFEDKIVDLDWAGPDCPILLTEKGNVFLTDVRFQTFSSDVRDRLSHLPTIMPCAPIVAVEIVRFWWCVDGSPEQRDEIVGKLSNEESIRKWMMSVMENADKMSPGYGPTEKCLIMNRLLGKSEELKFWTTCLHYFKSSNADSGDANTPPLEASYHYLCDARTFKRMQLEELESFHWKWRPEDGQHCRRMVIERLILMGERDKAVQLLLETDLESAEYEADATKACLIATLNGSQGESAQCTIKLVATNFIANGKVWEGVQLLRLLDKSADACRYLISNGLYEGALWLAKCALSPAEAKSIVCKCALHVANIPPLETVSLLVSQRDFQGAAKHLGNKGDVLEAALLLHSCNYYGITVENELSREIEENLREYFAKYDLQYPL